METRKGYLAISQDPDEMPQDECGISSGYTLFGTIFWDRHTSLIWKVYHVATECTMDHSKFIESNLMKASVYEG